MIITQMRHALRGAGLALSFALCGLSPLPVWAQSPAEALQETPQHVIEAAMQDALVTAALARLEAPEAARLYLLTALALHDSYEIANGRNGYVSRAVPSQKTDPQLLMRAAARAVLDGDDAERALGSSIGPLDQVGAQIANDLMQRLPKPAPGAFAPSGAWRPPAGQAPVLPQWRDAKPLTLSHAAQFRPSGPPPKTSAVFAQQLAQVKRLGEDVSSARTADNAVSSRYWKAPAGTPTPPGQWNQIALQTGAGLDAKVMLDRLLALNAALYDTGIAAWDSKYTYQAARPEDVIAKGPADGILTEGQDAPGSSPFWVPMGDTPVHPEYVSGHSAFSAAGAAALTVFDGARGFCFASAYAFNIERCYVSYQDAAIEAGMSRIYAGLHFKFSDTDGQALGRSAAAHALETLRAGGAIELPVLPTH